MWFKNLMFANILWLYRQKSINETQQNDLSQYSLKVFEFCCDADWLTDWLTDTRKLERVDAPKRTAK